MQYNAVSRFFGGRRPGGGRGGGVIGILCSAVVKGIHYLFASMQPVPINEVGRPMLIIYDNGVYFRPNILQILEYNCCTGDAMLISRVQAVH